MKLPLNSSQTIAVVAITAALAAGAYALGLAQTAGPQAAPAALSDATPAVEQDSKPAAPAEPALCPGCSHVLSVRSELRQAESGSGLGAIGGAVVGGLLGNQIGGGNGKKLATVGGAVAGGFAGNEIEKNANKKRVWIVELEDRDGRVHKREQASDPQLRSGDVVSVREGRLVRR